MGSGVADAVPFLSVDFENSQSVTETGFQPFNQHDAAGRTYSTSEGNIFVNVAGEQPAGEDGYFDRGPIPDNGPFTYGDLYRDFAFNNNEKQMVFTMSGLSANTAYSVTWFSYDTGGSHSVTFAGINGSGGTAGPLNFTGGVVPTENYDPDNSITALFTTNSSGALTVRATDIGTLTVNGFEIAVPPPTNVPGTPAISNVASGDGSLTVSWSAITVPVAAASYKVLRGPTPTGPWTEIATVTAPATTYLNTGLTNRTEYCYQIRAVSAANVTGNPSAARCNSPFPASGSTIGWNVPWGTAGNASFAGALGMDFVVDNPITVTRLGIFDHNSDGISSTITARIFDLDNPGPPVAELVFNPGTPGVLLNGSRYQTLSSPLALPHGFRGTIVAVGFNTTDPNGDRAVAAPWTTNSGGGSVFFTGTGRFGDVAFPNDLPGTLAGGPANRYAAGTFEFTQGAAAFPGVPVLSIVTPGLDQSARLNWPAVTVPLPAVRYDIYRSTDGFNFTNVGNTTLPRYLDAGLTNGTTYFYRVRAVATGGAESVDSEIVSTTPVIPQAGVAYVVPAGLVGTSTHPGSVGFDFEALRTVDITQLGCFDSGSDGIAGTLSVRLYDITGATPVLVAQQTFTNADPGTLVGGSRFKTLATPLRINPGFRGRLASDGYSAADLLGNNEDNNPIPITTNDGGQTLRFLPYGYIGDAGQMPRDSVFGPAHRFAAGTFYFTPTICLTVYTGDTVFQSTSLTLDCLVIQDGGTLVLGSPPGPAPSAPILTLPASNPSSIVPGSVPTQTTVATAPPTTVGNVIPSDPIPATEPTSLTEGQGTYGGLLDSGTVGKTKLGVATFTVSRKGRFTGSIQYEGSRYTLSGKFDRLGHFAGAARSRGHAPLVIALSLDLAGGTGQLTGTISNGSRQTVFSADRAAFSAKASPSLQAGRYIVELLSGVTEEPSLPTASGLLRVQPSGSARLVGRLIDGTPFSFGGQLSKQGTVPILTGGTSAMIALPK